MPPKSLFSTMLIAAALGCVVSLPSYAQPVDPIGEASHSRPAPYSFVISPDDVLDIVVFDVAELSREYRVSPTGTVTVSLISEPLNAAGLTLQQFGDKFADALRERGLVSDPHVSVSIKESRVHSVAITGAVKNPQIYPLLGESHLLDVLSQAGGLADNAGTTINITRGQHSSSHSSEEAQSDTIIINLTQLLDGASPALNLPVYPGDAVTVPVAGVVYVVGAVNRSGGFPLNMSHQELTVLQAIALAEDTKSTAVRDKGMIVRRGTQYPDGREEIPVNVGQILAGTRPDVRLQANDILFIPDSTAKKAFRRGAEAAIQIATGLAIWHY